VSLLERVRRQRRASRGEIEEHDLPARDNFGLRMMLGPARWLAAIAGRLGAQRELCELILITRLRLDMRSGGLRSPNKARGAGMLMTCLMFGVSGVLIGLFVNFGEMDDLRAMGLVQIALMLTLGALLVSDYLSVLLDPAEADLLAPRPVSGRTVILARLAHLVLYLAVPVGSFVLVPWIFGALGRGGFLWFVIMPVISVLSTTFVLATVLIVFVELLERLDGERLAAMLLRGQILASFALFGSYYIGLGLFANDTSRAWLLGDHMGLAWVPPYWFGGLYAAAAGRHDTIALLLAVLAVVVPLALMVLLLMRAGHRLVTGLASAATGAGEVSGRPGFVRRSAARLVAPGLERAGFDLFVALAARERGFRSRVYPMLIVPFLMFAWMAMDESARSGQLYIWGSLIPMFYGILILVEVRNSDTPGAAWIFASAPIEKHGLIVSGVVKALSFAFLLPWMVLVLLASRLMSQDLPLTDVAFGTAIAIVVTLFAARLVVTDAFPFSRAFSPKQNQRFGLFFGTMICLGLVAGLQRLLAEVTGAVEIGTLVLVPVIVLQMRSLRNMRVDPKTIPPAR
jgi:hypothetical protein